MQIIDAHHHLWNLGACSYPWLMAKGVTRFFGDPTPIQQNYLVDDLRADARDYELLGSVHIQVGVADGDELAETRWVQQTADQHGLPSALVAFCDLTNANVSRQLDAHAQAPALRGVRQIVGRSAEEDAVTGSGALLRDPAWAAGLAALCARNLSFDLQLIPGQVARAVDVFAGVPGLKVALCHCGSPWDQSPEGIRGWRRGLRQLAALPDICCKLSGFGMFDHDWTIDSIRPLVESCIEIFGAERCMFGSNFPVDKLHASYAKIWGAYETITAGLSERDRQRLFVGTAREFYRL